MVSGSATTRAGTPSPAPLGGGQDLARKLSWYMALRAGIVTLLLGGTVVLNAGSVGDLESPTPQFLLAVVAATYATTLGYGLLYRRVGGEPWFARLQLATDLVAWTAVVYATGGALSGFTFLYGVVVTVAAILLGRTAAFWTTAIAVGLFSLLVGCLWLGVVAPLPDQHFRYERADPSEIVFALLLNATAMLLIANLSGYLADRLQRAGGALREAEKRSADLEARFEDIVRSLESGLLTVDTHWTIRSANPMACHLLGCLEPQILGRAIDEALGRFAADVRARDRGEAAHVRTDGTEIPLGFTVSPLLDSRGKESGHLILFQDLSERQRLRREVEVAERFAALGRLAAGLAHEIRNPLGAIKASAQYLEEGGEGPTVESSREFLDIIVDEVNRLNRVVSSFLDYARPHRGNPVPIDLNAAVRRTVQTLQPGRTDDVEMVLELEDDLPAVAVDAEQIRQVFLNLIQNAVQAMEGKGKLTIASAAVDEPRGTAPRVVEVRFTDTGRGISKSVMRNLFVPFFTTKEKGTGLGLAISQRIVQNAGGSIQVHTSAGGGTTFTVVLPVAEVAPRTEDDHPPPERPAATG